MATTAKRANTRDRTGTGSIGSKSEQRWNWISVDAVKVKKGQAIQVHHDKIEEIIDLIKWSPKEERVRAKKNSRDGRHFCIVMGDPRRVEQDGDEMVLIPVLHCTKSTSSRLKRWIYRPMPHHSELWKNLSLTRGPLKVKTGSPEFEHQSYVIPYEIFEIPFKPGSSALVSKEIVLVRAKRD